MKNTMIICGTILGFCAFLAWQDNSSQWFVKVQALTIAEEADVVAGEVENGYYCTADTRGCVETDPPSGGSDIFDLPWCTKVDEGKDCPGEEFCGAGENQKCEKATWGFQWLYDCTLRSQPCPRKILVCKKLTAANYLCNGSRTIGYSGCGDHNRCD